MPRFVILEHDHPHLHWDLMLQVGDVLRTWRLAEPPEPGKAVTADLIFDHRLMYLDYEGPVSGNRGQVKRWEWGNYQGPAADHAEAGTRIELELQGQRLNGKAVLICLEDGQWRFQISAGSNMMTDRNVD